MARPRSGLSRTLRWANRSVMVAAGVLRRARRRQDAPHPLPRLAPHGSNAGADARSASESRLRHVGARQRGTDARHLLPSPPCDAPASRGGDGCDIGWVSKSDGGSPLTAWGAIWSRWFLTVT